MPDSNITQPLQCNTNMDFIERIFGVSPDGGSGTFELLLLVIPTAGLYVLRRMRSRSRKVT